MTRPRSSHALFLAPHYDDVALSCGGTVAALADAGSAPAIITILGGAPPPEELTAFARWQHQRWGTEADDTVAIRLHEEREASALLGATIETLDFLDAIYRGEHYLSDDALFGPVVADDLPLVEAIVARLHALYPLDRSDTALYVPLGVGNHVDHQIVFEVGRSCASRGLRVLAYEDFPYAALGDARAQRLAAVQSSLGAAEICPVAGTLDRRIAAIAAYRTQLPTIFRFFDDWPAAIRSYAAEIGGVAGPAERFWPVRSDS